MGDTAATWSKEKGVEVRSMRYSQDKSLFVLATTRGYRVFDATTLEMVSQEDDYQEIIGNISQAQTLFRSQLVFFVGAGDSETEYSTYMPNQLIVWNDLKKAKTGIIMMKQNITSFTLTQDLLAIFSSNSLYLFEVHSLKYIMKIVNLSLNSKLYSICEDTVAYTTIQKKSVVNVVKILFSNHKVKSRKQMKINTSFQEIQAVHLSNCCGLLFVVSLLGNKVHVYDLSDCHLKSCVFTGNKIISIENIQFSPKQKHVLYISDQVKLEVINIKPTTDNTAAECTCDSHDDSLMLGNPKRKPSLFEGLMSGFTEKGKVSSGLKLVASLDIPNDSLLYAGFDMKKRNELKTGLIKRYAYSKQKGQCQIQKVLQWWTEK